MNAIAWFEIPATDLNRAFEFYTKLTGMVRKGTFNNSELILFDVPFTTGEAVGGAIVQRQDLVPSTNGTLVYIPTPAPLSNVTAKIELLGGKLLIPELNLGKFGFAAIFIDSEGNKIGLISQQQ